MSQLQPLIEAQQGAEGLHGTPEMLFWLEKVVAWGQAESSEALRDTCLHLSRLRDFLRLLLTHMGNMGSTADIMERLPVLGQLLGRLLWNPGVTADAASRGLLLECVWRLHTNNPSTAIERKANQWIQKAMCQIVTEEDDAEAQALVRHVGVSPDRYRGKVLEKMVALLLENIGNSCGSPSNPNQRCRCGSVLATSEACVPLVSCPEAAPLLAALLQRPGTCERAALSEAFLDAIASAHTSKRLLLDDHAVVCLWYHSLPSLEGAVLSLMESVLTSTGTSAPLSQLVMESLLPKASAQHCSIFLVVNDIYRSVLKQAEGNESIRSLIQTFTSCFLREVSLLQSQENTSLRAFFPQSPPTLLLPFLTQPSETPRESWRHHLIWLCSSLRGLTEEEEEEGEDVGEEDGGSRGQHQLFEAWFLLVQCAHWVYAALQLLPTAAPEDCCPLVWLLNFYYHPTNRGHQRAWQLARASRALDHLRLLFTTSTHPHPDGRPQPLAELLSGDPRRPSPAILSLLVHFAVFAQLSLRESTHVFQTVVECCGCAAEAECVLNSEGLRLSAGICSSHQANTVQLRIKALQDTLARMQTEPR